MPKPNCMVSIDGLEYYEGNFISELLLRVQLVTVPASSKTIASFSGICERASINFCISSESSVLTGEDG